LLGKHVPLAYKHTHTRNKDKDKLIKQRHHLHMRLSSSSFFMMKNHIFFLYILLCVFLSVYKYVCVSVEMWE